MLIFLCLNQTSSQFKKLDQETNSITEKILAKLQKQEEHLSGMVKSKDSVLNKLLFESSKSYYQRLNQKLKLASDSSQVFELTEYMPYLDTIKTSLEFLQQKADGIYNSQLKEAQELLQQYQNRIQITNTIKQEIQQREQLLKEQLYNLGFVKELQKINKDIFYYNQQLNEYKTILKDPKRLQAETPYA